MQKDTRTGKTTIFYRGKNYTLTELSKKLGIHRTTLRRRINKGIPIV